MTPRVNVVVVTYRRPEQLLRALESLRLASEATRAPVRVGVTVVDDDPEGSARPVASTFETALSDGCRYVFCGSRNISKARNAGLEATLGACDWIASIDDDVEVPVDWFDNGLEALADGRFTAVTGSLVKDFSAGPSWLTREPFDQIGITAGVDGQLIDICATGNNWVSAAFIKRFPDLRYDPALGVSGGEDVDFFGRAVRLGLLPVYLDAVAVVERQPPSRCTFRYQLRRACWLGITEARRALDHRTANRLRLLLRAAKRLVTGDAQHLDEGQRHARGVRFLLAVTAQSVGLVLGCCGATLHHT